MTGFSVPTPLHIGVAGPCSPRAFAADLGLSSDRLPEGLGGTPVNHLVRAWLDGGHRVTLATLDREHEEPTPSVYRGELLTLTVGSYRAQHRARDAFRTERRAITAGLLLNPPDVISAHWSYEFALGAIATGIPTLVTVHDVPREIFRLQPTPYRAVRWAMHRQAMKAAGQVAFNSPYTREKLGHRRAKSGVVLPNAIPDTAFSLKPRSLPNPVAPRFVSVSNGFGKLKNTHQLLRAFSLVRAQIPDAELKLVGNGFEANGLALAWARTKGLEGGVEFAGPTNYETTMAAIASSDVLVHPSLEESFGYTLIEAASVGTPVIGGAASGAVPWVLGEGEAGVLVDVRDPQSIATAMVDLVTTPDEWCQLRVRAHVLTRERFSTSTVASAYLSVIRGLNS